MPAVSSVREELMFVSRQQRVTAVLCCHSPCHATQKISRSPRGRRAGGRQHDEGVHSAIAPLPAHRTQTANATAESSGKRTVPDERGTPLWERERLGKQRNHTQVSCRPTTDVVNDSTREQVAKDFTWHKPQHLLPAEKLAAVAVGLHSDSTQKWYTLTHTHVHRAVNYQRKHTQF